MREKPPEEVVVFPHPAKSAQTTESAHAGNAIATRTRNPLENAARLKKRTSKMNIAGARARMHAQVKTFFVEGLIMFTRLLFCARNLNHFRFIVIHFHMIRKRKVHKDVRWVELRIRRMGKLLNHDYRTVQLRRLKAHEK